MPEKYAGIFDAIMTSLLFAAIGVLIGLGRLMNSGAPITRRLVIGRAISTGGIAMAAGAALVWIPSLPLLGQIGIAAGLASLGTSGLERMFGRVVGGKRDE